jgi:hypothetical protein
MMLGVCVAVLPAAIAKLSWSAGNYGSVMDVAAALVVQEH